MKYRLLDRNYPDLRSTNLLLVWLAKLSYPYYVLRGDGHVICYLANPQGTTNTPLRYDYSGFVVVFD